MADPPAPGPRAARPVLVAWLLLSGAVAAAYARAELNPPPGTTFDGYFWFVDDAYNYLSFVQQAEQGAFLFRNKLVLEPHDGALVNLEWWVVGLLSRLLGGEPVLAYRLFGLAALAALVAGIRAWLKDAGLPETHALAALALVCIGGGGGAMCTWRGYQGVSCLDVRSGLFPFLEILANPHFVTGTALLLWSLRAARVAVAGTGGLPLARAAVLGSALALVRPYDFVMLGAIGGLSVLLSRSARPALRFALLGALLLPAVGYNAWVFYAVRSFRTFQSFAYVFPAPADFAWALGPAAAVAVIASLAARARGRRPGWQGGDETAREAVRQLAVWLALGAVIMVAHPVNYSLQFLVGIGVPLLGMAALSLAAFPPRATWLAAGALSSAAVAAFAITLAREGPWYVPTERLAAGRLLAGLCGPDDVLLAPPDIGLYAGAYSSCRGYVSHKAALGYPQREAEVRAFYATPDVAGGPAVLDRACAAHVALPAAASPAAFIGSAPYRLAGVAGRPPKAIAMYSRTGPTPCAGRP